MKTKWIQAAVLAVTLLCGVAASRTANAQAAGFTVAPAQLSFTVNPADRSQTSTVTITNTYDVTLQLTAELQAIDESGVRLVPAGPVDAVLASTVKLSATDITVPPHGSYPLRVSVTDGVQLADGGHYASLVLTQRPITGTASTFRSAVSVNVFIIKNQNIRTDLQLAGLSVKHTLFSLPSTVTATFKNLGNTHIVPRGSVSIYEGQTLIGKAVLNTNSQLLLPGRQAEFMAPVEIYSRPLLPRQLRVQTMYRIEGSDVQLMHEQVFWHVPFIDVVVLIGVIGIIWWRRRQIGRLLAKTAGAIRAWIRKSNIFGRRKRASGTAKSTNRILGRTVIRTHRAATLQATHSRVSKVLGPSAISNTKQIPVQQRIAVIMAEDTTPALAVPKPPKTAKPMSEKVAKTKKTPAKPPKKITKKTASSSTKKASSKTTKPAARTVAAKMPTKAKKPSAKTTRKKTP